MESKRICCWRAQQWTFAVAILTMILSFAKLLHAVLTPIPANAYNTETGTDTDVENDTRYSSKSEAEFMKWRYSPSVNSGGPAISFLLGILLFIGENNKRPVLLTIWLVAQCLGSCLVLLVFGFFVYILIVKDVAGESGLKHYAPVFILMGVFALLTLQLFSMWVVKTYRRELLDANDFYTDNGDGIGDRRSSNVDRIYPFHPNNNGPV